ncbi:MAG: hypothetical protein V1743_08360 [Nanoarchaeota archaeon]
MVDLSIFKRFGKKSASKQPEPAPKNPENTPAQNAAQAMPLSKPGQQLPASQPQKPIQPALQGQPGQPSPAQQQIMQGVQQPLQVLQPAQSSFQPVQPSSQQTPPDSQPAQPSLPQGQPSPQQSPVEDEVIKTGVDDLIKLLSEYPKLSIDEVSKKLNIPKHVLQAWIDFLVEERILGIEYSFTTPYIYLNKPKEKESEHAKKLEGVKPTYKNFKDEFYQKAVNDKIPQEKIEEYWKNHLKAKLDAYKDYFIREARKRNLPRSDELWQIYSANAFR